jgi:hypothetical protein
MDPTNVTIFLQSKKEEGGGGGIFFKSFDTCKEDTAHVHMWLEAGFLQLLFRLPSIAARVAVYRGKIRARFPLPSRPRDLSNPSRFVSLKGRSFLATHMKRAIADFALDRRLLHFLLLTFDLEL